MDINSPRFTAVRIIGSLMSKTIEAKGYGGEFAEESPAKNSHSNAAPGGEKMLPGPESSENKRRVKRL